MSKEDKSSSWFVRHKVLSVLGVLIVLGIIISAANGSKSNTDTSKSSNSDSSQTEKQADTKPKTETLTIKNSTATDKGYGLIEVDGEVTNNDTGKHSATLKATFYDANGKILGTASGAVNDLAPGETKTFSLISTDKVTGYADMKVQVDTLL